MSPVSYKYTLEQCDVEPSSRRYLARYREFRLDCLERLRGSGGASAARQIQDLAWDTVAFRTFNESRRLEPRRKVNGQLWEFLTEGYISKMVLGIRRLVDRDESTTSLFSVLQRMRRQPEMLTREAYVCHDGLPYDYQKVLDEHIANSKSRQTWLSRSGPLSFETSERAHRNFDALCGRPAKRKRSDKVSLEVFDLLEVSLSSPEIKRITALADRRFAHAEHLDPDAAQALFQVTFNDLEGALARVTKAANFISGHLLFDAVFGDVVPTAQYDVLEHLDRPWMLTKNLPKVHEHREQTVDRLNRLAYTDGSEFLPTVP